MCGIVAIFNRGENAQFADARTVELMRGMILHRGHDNYSLKRHKTITVGYNRLAITARSRSCSYGFELAAYLNGEIYNYRQLAKELELPPTASERDVLERGFFTYGPKFVKRLNGMFVILLVMDKDVYIFRDRYGIKPIYIYGDAGKIYIASEIKAFLQVPDFKPELNEHSADEWMSFNNTFSHANTTFKNVALMPQGHYLHLNTGAMHKYWQWEYNTIDIPYIEAVALTRELVIQAIQRQIPGEVDFGCCLSSGVDSNIIYSQLPAMTPTFTVGFSGEDDERKGAEAEGMQNYHVVYRNVQWMEEAIYALEDLRVGASWSNYGLCKLASKFCEVLFDGAGADELFGGYPWRYDMSKDYFTIVNRTGIDNPEMRARFALIYPVDSPENRRAFDAVHFLPGVLLVGDKMSMANTIEMRVPFLDNDLVDFVLTLPLEYLQGKKLLKDAFREDLNPAIIEGKKRGFSSPDWFAGPGNQAERWATAALQTWKDVFLNFGSAEKNK